MRFTFLLFMSALLSACGCGQPTGNSGGGDAFQDKLDKIRAEVHAKIDADQAEKRKIVSEEARALLPASSKEQLAEAYKIAFAVGDITAMEQMVYFENVDTQEMKDAFMVRLGVRQAREYHITGLSIVPLDENDKQRYPNLMPVAMAEVSARNNDDSGGSSTTFPIVEVDGKFYFFFRIALPEEYADEDQDAG